MNIRAACFSLAIASLISAGTASAQYYPYPGSTGYPTAISTPAPTPTPYPSVTSGFGEYPPVEADDPILFPPGSGPGSIGSYLNYAVMNCGVPLISEEVNFVRGPFSATCTPLFGPDPAALLLGYECSFPNSETTVNFNCGIDADGNKACRASAVSENLWIDLGLAPHYISFDMGVPMIGMDLNSCLRGRGNSFFEWLDVDDLTLSDVRFGYHGDKVNYSCRQTVKAFKKTLSCENDVHGYGEVLLVNTNLEFRVADWQPFPRFPVSACVFAKAKMTSTFDFGADGTATFSAPYPYINIGVGTPGTCTGSARGRFRFNSGANVCPLDGSGRPSCGCFMEGCILY